MSTSSRREFLKSASLTSAGFLALSGHVHSKNTSVRNDLYGPLIPDPKGILDLPKGFRYTVVAKTGQEMDDGLLRPGSPDGMAAFSLPDGKVALICNHELSSNAARLGAFGKKYERLSKVDKKKIYDFRRGNHLHMGGTTTLIVDPNNGKLESQFMSLAGTDRNCAGGPTPWGTWVTCEEPSNTTKGSVAQEHGFVFEVPVTTEPGLVEPKVIREMGRFRHEAVAVEPESGVVYLTEDRGEGLIYRFLPKKKGDLTAGGKLQALVYKGKPSFDTRNWDGLKTEKLPVGTRHEVEWVDLDKILAPKDDLRFRGFKEKGAACFARGEGMFFGNKEVYWACTNGGSRQFGQIFRYIPSPYEGTPQEMEKPATLELFLESDSTNLLEMCDNITVAPWGDLIICEDGTGEEFVRGVTRDGAVYNLAKNAKNDSEFCGACFAPNHPVLFVNIQSPGLTLAISGEWDARS